jgi:hypothetical protein
MHGIEDLRRLTPEGLALLGTPDLAYVKAIVHEGRTAYSISAADGAELAVVDDRDLAFAVARQHDLEPLSVH